MNASTLRAVAKDLCAIPGVLSVFTGLRRRRDTWTAETCLSVHVRKKIPRGELRREARIPRKVEGYATDVVPVGRPRLHAVVDSDDQLVAAYDALERRSAVSALAQEASGKMLALGSGHGLLPIANGEYVSGAWGPKAGRRVFVRSDPDETEGLLAFGALDTGVDFGVVRFASLEPPTALLGHLFAPTPIAVRSTPLEHGEVVQHEAPVRGYRVTGQVMTGRALKPFTLASDAGVDVTYDHLFTVANADLPFSVAGESGSIVFDGDRQAVGSVVGGGTDPQNKDREVTYVLGDFGALQQKMGSAFSLFFGGLS